MSQARWLFALVAALSGLAVTGCSGGSSSSTDDSGTNLGWDNQTNIEVIFEANCSGCHGTAWSSCWDVQASGATIESAVSSGAMPRGGSMSASDKATLLGWLQAGANCTGPRENVTTGGSGGGAPPVAAAGEAPTQ